MRGASQLGSSSHFRLPPNLLIWFYRENLKTKSKALASWELLKGYYYFFPALHIAATVSNNHNPAITFTELIKIFSTR